MYFPVEIIRITGRGAFTNYVYKTRYVGGSKCPLFGNIHTIENVNVGG